MDARTTPRWQGRSALADLLRSPWLGPAVVRLAIVGLLAIGISSAVAAVMGSVYGRPFVSGDPPGLSYTKARCADYLEYEPDARSCEQAATWHHYGETVGYRTDAGVLGLLMLAGYWFLRRRKRISPSPKKLVALVATAAFGLAAIGLLGQSLILVAKGYRVGIGDYLSAGIVSGAAALLSVVWWLREGRGVG